ncbi:DUF2135 domain-containing protein [Ramlibacter sp. G-1-2-2]|uniref:DUF2135 domain-containing protein n=1 Tax=Ramlibacter agri TaxID=2728837 RepID=A0A848H517_9BURK|nr:VIT domain-containing protein [Ramlibacter agri]NML44609.1 DUF2135 domain-containing protein [Ramlibacter agri]
MIPLFLGRLLALAWLALAACSAAAQVRTPPAVLRVPDARLPVELRRVSIEGSVTGLAAQTRVELEFFNPNARVLEGELQFPLLPGQVVTGFALDINGELRAAVPVEKAKARQVFEDVTRTRVDPALLEAAGGNNYKLRVYPLPAQGTRRVVLEIGQTLARGPAAGKPTAAYVLPVAFGTRVDRLHVSVRVARYEGAFANWGQFGGQRLAVRPQPDGSALLDLDRSGYDGRDSLRLDLAVPANEPAVLAQAFGDATWFYAEAPVALKTRARKLPGNVAIVWDASGSGAKRDLGREIQLLAAFFRRVPDVQVQLLVVRDVAEAPQRFTVAGGNWLALREHLRTLAYDGATRLDQMAVPAGADLALLFSDGLGNYGEGSLPTSPVPLYTVSSTAGADTARLRHAAEASGATLLDLTRASPVAATAEALQARTRLLAVDGAGASDIVFESRYPQDGRLQVAGRLDQPRAELALQLQEPDGTLVSRKLVISASTGTAPGAVPVAAQRWAMLRLAELEADRDRNQAAIRRIGKQFGLATSGTSLIVLDSLADYVRYEIEPPPSMRDAYLKMLATRARWNGDERQAHLEKVVRRYESQRAWWEKDFPKDAPPRTQATTKADEEARQRERVAGTARPMAQAVPAPAPMLRAAPAPAAAEAPAADRSAGGNTRKDAAATVALQPWQPDSPYARRLRESAPEAMYAIYLDERPSHARSTAFFLDAADIFLERGQRMLALRILSNLAEMDLENRQVLRLLAYRLVQAKEVQLALPLLRQVLALSPDEPQSYRDLGLALAAAGQPQQAVERLWEVVTRPWADRFPDIELVALEELNAIAARDPVDVSKFDARLLRAMPVDLRAVLAWDSDNTDIDLHVIDPNGEEAFFGHPLTYQGGRMSRDFTGGYGPEEFSLRQAKPGTYTVKAHFYGHNQQILSAGTTIMLRLTTGFGTPAQKDHEVVMRLSGAGREVVVGTFEVGGPSP